MDRRTLRRHLAAGRGLAPFVLVTGAVLCLYGWLFAFSPAGVPLLIAGSAAAVAAILLRPTPAFLIAGTAVLLLAWGGPLWFWILRAASTH